MSRCAGFARRLSARVGRFDASSSQTDRKGRRIDKVISRYRQIEGGDDKITCAGSAKAYDEFMDNVMDQG